MIKLIPFGKKTTEKTVVVLGFSDALHIGHAFLIKKAKEIAGEKHAKVCVFTFENDVPSALGKGDGSVFSLKERAEKAERLGVDYIQYAFFDENFKSLSPRDFVDKVLSENIVSVVCGYDYTFGKNASGNAEILKKLCEAKKVFCFVSDKVEEAGERVSTTKIKELLKAGDMPAATRLLGEPYFISGNVIEGRKIGRTLGFPTVNIIPDDGKARIRYGVYKSRIFIGGKEYRCITNYGGRPTYGLDGIVVETYISEYDGDLYGKRLSVFFDEFIRDDKTFKDENELKTQLREDLERIK